MYIKLYGRVRNLKFAWNLKFATSKSLVNFMKKMMFLSKNWYFSVQKALIYYTVNKSHHNSFILLVFLHVANFRYVANFRFLTLPAMYNVTRFISASHFNITLTYLLCDSLQMDNFMACSIFVCLTLNSITEVS